MNVREGRLARYGESLVFGFDAPTGTAIPAELNGDVELSPDLPALRKLAPKGVRLEAGVSAR